MSRQLISRSGGLLEIISTALKMETSSTEGESEDGASDIAVHDVAIHDLDDFAISVSVVQFIHQTVKDFVAANRSGLGLFLDPSFKAESGYLYLLESGTSFGGTWAKKLSSFIFEYAFLAETEGSTDVVRLYKAFHPMLSIESGPQRQIKQWVNKELPQFALHFGLGKIEDLLLILIAAADLKRLVGYQIEGRRAEVDATSIPPALLTMVATGKRLSTSSASRESMIILLLKLGVGVDQYTRAIDASDIYGFALFGNNRTALTWVLRHEHRQHISNEERYSIARLLLENRANPNALAVADRCCPDGTTLLRSCIQHYDVEAVRLLLLHEADASQFSDYLVSFKLRLAEAVRGETTMSKLLGEYSIETRLDLGTLDTISCLVVQSVSLIVIGSSHIGEAIGYGLRVGRYE
jgi:hypothetical protein